MSYYGETNIRRDQTRRVLVWNNKNSSTYETTHDPQRRGSAPLPWTPQVMPLAYRCTGTMSATGACSFKLVSARAPQEPWTRFRMTKIVHSGRDKNAHCKLSSDCLNRSNEHHCNIVNSVPQLRIIRSKSLKVCSHT